jgi:hypothetical protein
MKKVKIIHESEELNVFDFAKEYKHVAMRLAIDDNTVQERIYSGLNPSTNVIVILDCPKGFQFWKYIIEIIWGVLIYLKGEYDKKQRIYPDFIFTTEHKPPKWQIRLLAGFAKVEVINFNQ